MAERRDPIAEADSERIKGVEAEVRRLGWSTADLTDPRRADDIIFGPPDPMPTGVEALHRRMSELEWEAGYLRAAIRQGYWKSDVFMDAESLFSDQEQDVLGELAELRRQFLRVAGKEDCLAGEIAARLEAGGRLELGEEMESVLFAMTYREATEVGFLSGMSLEEKKAWAESRSTHQPGALEVEDLRLRALSSATLRDLDRWRRQLDLEDAFTAGSQENLDVIEATLRLIERVIEERQNSYSWWAWDAEDIAEWGSTVVDPLELFDLEDHLAKTAKERVAEIPREQVDWTLLPASQLQVAYARDDELLMELGETGQLKVEKGVQIPDRLRKQAREAVAQALPSSFFVDLIDRGFDLSFADLVLEEADRNLGMDLNAELFRKIESGEVVPSEIEDTAYWIVKDYLKSFRPASLLRVERRLQNLKQKLDQARSSQEKRKIRGRISQLVAWKEQRKPRREQIKAIEAVLARWMADPTNKGKLAKVLSKIGKKIGTLAMLIPPLKAPIAAARTLIKAAQNEVDRDR